MRRLSIGTAVLAGCLAFFAQKDVRANTMVHDWSQRFGDDGGEGGTAVATDGSGNAIVTGNFSGTVNFGGGDLTSAGASDIFIAKFNSVGVHQWSRRFGDGNAQISSSVATDASGNVLVTGMFLGTVNFGGGDLTSAGASDIFVAKFDAAGVHQWSQRFGDADNQSAYAVATDANGNVFVTGGFLGTVNFGGGDFNSAGRDIFLVKFNADGLHQWSQRFGDARVGERGDQVGIAVSTDVSGNVVLTGFFQGSLNFGGGELRDVGGYDIFLAKFNSVGVHQWSRRFGDGNTQQSTSVATDASGNVIVCGYFQGTLYFGGVGLTGQGGWDIFVAKFDAAGVHHWSQRFGDGGNQVCTSASTDVSGNVIVAGHFQGTVNFGGGNLTGAGWDIFVAKFDAAGVHDWGERFGDASDQLGPSVATDGAGNVVVTGSFSGTINFGGGDLASAGSSDIFLAKFSASPVPVAISELAGSERGGGVDLTWRVTADESFAGFRVYRAMDSTDWSDFTVVEDLLPSSARSYRDESVTNGNTYAYFIAAVMSDGRELSSPMVTVNVSPLALALEQNIPNPFNPATIIAFTLPNVGSVELAIYSVDGRAVRTLRSGVAMAGRNEARWDGTDELGQPVGSGVYFYRLRAGANILTRKMVLLK